MHRFWLSGTLAEVEHESIPRKRRLICSLKSWSTCRSCGGLSSLQEVKTLELPDLLKASDTIELAKVMESGSTLGIA